MEKTRNPDEILDEIKSDEDGPQRLKGTVRVLEKIASDNDDIKTKCERDSTIISEARKTLFGNAKYAEKGLYHEIKKIFAYIKTYIFGETIEPGRIAELEQEEDGLRYSAELLEEKIRINEEAYQKTLDNDMGMEINIMDLEAEYRSHMEEKSAKEKELDEIKAKIPETSDNIERANLGKNKIQLEREIEKANSLMNVCAEATIFYNQYLEMSRKVHLPNWSANIEQTRGLYYGTKLQIERTKKTKESTKMNFDMIEQSDEISRYANNVSAITNELDTLFVKISSNARDSKSFFNSLNTKNFEELKKTSAKRKKQIEQRREEYCKAAEKIWEQRKQYC